jgi:Ni,Fe-hydrogenase I cytochrome b subunit
MTQQTNSTEKETSIFIQKNSAAIRIWHWFTFLIVISLIVTVLLESTILNQRKNAPEIQAALKEKGIEVNNNQAFAVTRLYGEKIWDIHKLLGYGLAFLFLSRIVIEFTQSKEEKNQARIKKAFFLYKQPGQDKKELKHYLFVKGSYMIFYLLLFMMVTTGLIIAFGADLGLSGPFRHTVKNVHGFVQYLIYAFVVIHLAGVIRSDISKYKGMVSGMINGNQ